MARRCRALPVPCFSDYSWAECDIDRGQSEATRNALECANLLLEGYFRALYAPLYAHCFGIVERRCNHIAKKKKKRDIHGRGFFFFISSLGSPSSFSLTFSSTFSSFLGSVFKSHLILLGYVIVEV